MKINVTKKQYKLLMEMLFAGNWLINGHRLPDERLDDYEQLEQHFLSFFKEFHMDDYIEYDDKHNSYFHTRKFEDEFFGKEYIEDYDEDTFWEELISRLALRDMVRDYGPEQINTMDDITRLEKKFEYEEKYNREFEENGLEKLIIK